MSIKDYEYILDELQHPRFGNVFQVAIGGGEPLEHPELSKIIEATTSRNIVPNLTTNGVHLDKTYARYLKGSIGAIALSVTDIQQLDLRKVVLLLEQGIRTNIHYVLSNRNIVQAVKILRGKFDELLSGLNSVIFLTHKPHGRGNGADVLKTGDDLRSFISEIDDRKSSLRVGFDACFVPMLLHFTNVDSTYIDSCECGFFSIYIDEKLDVKPCSFDNKTTYSFNLKEHSFSDIWEHKLEGYRSEITNNCKRACSNKSACRGACHFYNEITCCFSKAEEDALYA